MLKNLWPNRTKTARTPGPRRLWMDLGDLGDLINPAGPHEQWQDHGLGLLRTLLHQNGVITDLASTRAHKTWDDVRKTVAGYDTLIMNVRSYTFPSAYRSAKIFKEVNSNGLVLTGGMHATVAPDEMEAIPEFDKICQGPPPVVTLITSRVCPWQCVFCNENSYIPNMGRRPVDMVIDELNDLDREYGVGSLVIHDSMFFQNPSWLEEWLEKYPRRANRVWSYWAAARADTVRQWPELFEALVRETNWNTVSIGFESGSDRVLRILNKECTEEDNYFTIDLLTRIGDEMEREGKQPPVFWSNIMLGIPGETRGDAIKTMRMVKYTKRIMPSIAFYAPYPGSALGHQLIAEGKSLMTKENYHRFPDDEKLRGIDYQFYRDLLAGKYDDDVNRGLDEVATRRRKVYTDALAKA